jgi:carboxyl-terminal processing protease
MIPIGLIALVTASASAAALADGPQANLSVAAPELPPDLAQRVQEITDVVLEHHLDPPARQQMILSGIKALDQAAGVPVPAGLGRRVSAAATPEQIAAFLAESWPKSTAKPIAANTLEHALFHGLLAVVPGGAELISAKDRQVAEQLEGNRYVGIHITLGMDDTEKRPVMMNVIERGPADRAGAKAGDLIEEIDGFDTQGVALSDVVDRLRGAEGTEVTIKVRKGSGSRTMRITRGQLPHPTIEGVRKRPSGDWDVRLDGPDPIGYLKITEIGASTPHELRKMVQPLEIQGARALILDLRGPIRANSVHPAVLLADCLLDRGSIGRVRTARGETTYQADPDALFRGWPIAVLVDSGTSGTAEWLVAALQDNHRATVVGTRTSGAMRARTMSGVMAPGATGIRSRVSVGAGSWSIELTTGQLERGDGRPMSRPTEVPIDELQSVLVPRPRPAQTETGVKPDLTIQSAIGPRVRIPRFMSPEPSREPSAASDESIERAIQWLRESLKKAAPSVS